MDFLYGETLTVRSITTTGDEYGDTSGTPSESEWGPCALAPRSSVERPDSQAPAVVTGLTIYGPVRPLDSDDEIVIPTGQYAGTWMIDGIPGEWKSPFTGWLPGIEVAVKRASAV